MSGDPDHTKVKFSFPRAGMFPEHNAACLRAWRCSLSVNPDCLTAIGAISLESEKVIYLPTWTEAHDHHL